MLAAAIQTTTQPVSLEQAISKVQQILDDAKKDGATHVLGVRTCFNFEHNYKNITATSAEDAQRQAQTHGDVGDEQHADSTYAIETVWRTDLPAGTQREQAYNW